jgi:hypothetical protein
LDIAFVDEEAYLNELVAYQLHFKGYKYDRLTCKLVEVHVDVLQNSSHEQSIAMATSFWSKAVVTTNEELEPIRGGTKLTIVPYTLFLPIETMEMHVVFNTQV